MLVFFSEDSEKLLTPGSMKFSSYCLASVLERVFLKIGGVQQKKNILTCSSTRFFG